VFGGAFDRGTRPSRAIRVMTGTKISCRKRLRRSMADYPVVWAQQQRVLGAFDGFRALPSNREGQTETSMRQRKIRVQLQRSAERSLRLLIAARSPQHHALRHVRPRIPLVGSKRGPRFGVRLRQSGPDVATARPSHERPGEQTVGLSIAGCDRDRASAQRLGLRDASGGALP